VAGIVSALLLLALATPKSPAVRFINPAGLAKSPRYSHVAEVNRGRLIFVSGQVAQDAAGNLVGAGDMAAQTRQVFENLKVALAAAGASYKDVVKLTSFIVDISKNIETYREVRQEYFRGIADPPTSTTVGVPALVRGDYLLEVEAIAVVP
jgi:enamine deaminase RidA (YjgF/YER057c/UK114 family)